MHTVALQLMLDTARQETRILRTMNEAYDSGSETLAPAAM